MDMKLSDILPVDVLDVLSDNGIISCKDFLSRNPLELMKYVGSPYSTVNQYITDVSNLVAPKSQTAFEMYCVEHDNHQRFLPTLLQKLDMLLQGGIPAGCITEISGPSASGKTQLCLQLSIVATSHGGVIYIDTEGAFSAQRLNKLRQLVNSLDVKLVVVDSIASLVRKEFDTRQKDGNAGRAAFLCKQATILKCIAQSYGIPVVVTNQITGTVSPDDSDSELDSDFTVTAALGNTWSHCVNTRLFMNPSSEGDKRTLIIAKSPLAPSHQVAYHISTKGLVMDWTGTVELAVHNATQEQMV